MQILNKIFIIVTSLFCTFISFASIAQTKEGICKDVHNGLFYSYPKNSDHPFIIERTGTIDKETDLKTGDSTIWNTIWKSDCESVSKYVSGNAKMSDDLTKFLTRHKLVYVVENITKDYYTFKGYVDNTSGASIQNDTIWFHKKQSITDNRVFVSVSHFSDIKKSHFGDTSKYAFLYIYRPAGRFKFSNSDYLVYFDDNVICTAKNNSGYIFKILQEGTFDIKSKYSNDESSIKLNIKFGKTYFVKSAMVGGLSKKLNNFKLEMTIESPESGKDEFGNVDFNKEN